MQKKTHIRKEVFLSYPVCAIVRGVAKSGGVVYTPIDGARKTLVTDCLSSSDNAYNI